MQDRLKYFTIYYVAFTVLAISLTVFLWFRMPPVNVHWVAVFWIILFATACELLAVSVSEGEGNGTLLMPSATVHWAAPCLFGPTVAIFVCAASAVAGHGMMIAAYYASRAIGVSESRVAPQVDGGRSPHGCLRGVKLMIVGLGTKCQVVDLRSRLESLVLYASTLAVAAGLSGFAYQVLGGQFLVDAGSHTNLLWNFVLPFMGLVMVSIAVNHGEYIMAMVIGYPVEGARGWYGLILRAKLALIEDVLPVWRGELFLVVVSLLMAFLYSRIGVLGLALAITPVLALRDFFGQWVKTKQAYLDTITTLATYMQHYHPYTRGHLKRVAEMSERLARELRLSAESIRHMNTAGFLHDIGKIAVSEEILDKTDKLTDDEWLAIKEHPVKGAEIISHLEFLEGIVDWIKYHHKWYNGMGYPGNGSDNGHAVPIEAAIIATADAFDAMTDDRELTLEWRCDSCDYVPEDGHRPRKCPKCGAEKRRMYREPKSLDEAIDELRRGAGSQFDPRVVKAFLTMVEREGIHLNE